MPLINHKAMKFKMAFAVRGGGVLLDYRDRATTHTWTRR